MGQGVEEGVGRRVVALARGAEDTGHGGVHREHGEVGVAGQLVQVQRRVDLRPQHPVDLFLGERGQDAVVEHTGGVHDAGQRVLGGHPGEYLGELVAVGRVTGGEHHPGAQLLQFGGEVGGAGGERAGPAGQDEGADSVLGDQMAGEERAEGAGTAGDQHRALRVEGSRHGEHDLADVPGLAHEAERLRRPPHVPGAGGQRVQHVRLEKPHDLGQDLPDAVGAGLAHVEGAVADPGVVGGDLFGLADVGLAHLQEPAAARQQFQGRVHELPRQGVQYDVDTGAAGGGQERVPEVQIARGRDALRRYTEPRDACLLRLARGRIHGGAQVLGELHRGHPHAARGGVNQHRLPRPQPGQIHQAVVRGQERHRHRGGLLERPALGDGGEHPGVGDGE